MEMRSINLTLVAIVGLFLATSGLWIAQREAGAASLTGANSIEQLASAGALTDLAGLSFRNQNAMLLRCYDALNGYGSLSMRYAGVEARASILARCESLATDLATLQPTQSYAWLIGAMAAAVQENWDGMNQRLLASQRSGRYEQWIAELRVALVERHFAQVSPDVMVAHESDLAMLVESRHGVASIALRYRRDPMFRERITAIVEKLPAQDQQRFLANVKIAFQDGL